MSHKIEKINNSIKIKTRRTMRRSYKNYTGNVAEIMMLKDAMNLVKF
jgi:hypothetical protein